jgi:hypothetical protein|tara:strand:+ start:1177 stop:1476 length:300 start_codon:yes stop_codon:yes gene_type:complete
MELHEAPEDYTKIVSHDPDRQEQIRLVVNTFRDIEYLSIRKYYLDFFEEWQPTNMGVSFPLTIENSRELFIGLTEILSLAESKEVIEKHFKDLINDIYI